MAIRKYADPVQLRLTDSDLSAARKLAKKWGVTLCEALRRLIVEAMKQHAVLS